jgi:hypothetical protein
VILAGATKKNIDPLADGYKEGCYGYGFCFSNIALAIIND